MQEKAGQAQQLVKEKAREAVPWPRRRPVQRSKVSAKVSEKAGSEDP